jgi:hypothetical protein
MKRFTATDKWDKSWYRALKPRHKCLWDYLLSKCDCAGVWEPDWELAGFQIGEKVSADDLKVFGERIQMMKGGKVFVVKFVEFQYGELSDQCRPHHAIFKALKRHGIGYAKGICTLEEQEQDKEQDNPEGVKGEPQVVLPPEPPKADHRKPESKEAVVAYAGELGLPASDGESVWDKWQGNGFTNGGKPMKDWRAVMRSWKGYGYLPSQKQSKHQPNSRTAGTFNEGKASQYANGYS